MKSGIVYTDEDILCILDGDDKFLHPYALSIVNDIYTAHPNCLLTYGQYITSRGRLGHCREYTEEEFYNLRKQDFRASHLKTFKWKLYREFLNQDPSLLSYKNFSGDFFAISYDAAIMIPLMEIAGYSSIQFNKHPIYWYRLYDRNDHVINREKQLEIEHEINTKKGFKPVFQTIRPHSLRKKFYFKLKRLFRKLAKPFLGE
jgi:glycosyltransferase involved in cell wall biosynthesis